jgi:hypothetical protein
MKHYLVAIPKNYNNNVLCVFIQSDGCKKIKLPQGWVVARDVTTIMLDNTNMTDGELHQVSKQYSSVPVHEIKIVTEAELMALLL